MFQEMHKPAVALRSPLNRLTSLLMLVFSLTTVSLAYAEPASQAEWKSVEEATAQVLTVDINTADAGELSEVLVGVGESKAKAIIAFRNQNGPFSTAQDLLQVKGIGEATLAKNEDRIRL